MHTPNTPVNVSDAVSRVISGELSMNAAAKLADVSVSGLRLKVLKHPDYDKAVADGRIAAKPAMLPRDTEELRKHPAVVDVVVGGMSYAAAGEKHGEYAATVHSWVKKAHPERFAQPKQVPLGIVRSPEFVAMRAALHSLASKVGISPEDLSQALVSQT